MSYHIGLYFPKSYFDTSLDCFFKYMFFKTACNVSLWTRHGGIIKAKPHRAFQLGERCHRENQ